MPQKITDWETVPPSQINDWEDVQPPPEERNKFLNRGNAARVGGSLLADQVGAYLAPFTGGLSYPVISGLGGAAAELTGQWLNDEPINFKTAALEGLFNLAPGPNLPKSAVLKEIAPYIAKSGGYGLAQGAAGAIPRHMAREERIFDEEGNLELPTLGEGLGEAAAGGIFGLGTGATLGYPLGRLNKTRLDQIAAVKSKADADAAAAALAKTQVPPPMAEPVPFMNTAQRSVAPEGEQSLFDFAKVPEMDQPSLFSVGDMPPESPTPPPPSMEMNVPFDERFERTPMGYVSREGVPQTRQVTPGLEYGADIGPYGLREGQTDLPFDENGQLNLGLNVVRPDHAVPVGSFAPRPVQAPPPVPPPNVPPRPPNVPPPPTGGLPASVGDIPTTTSPPIARAPLVAPHGVTISDNGHIATINQPSAGASKILEDNGYVPVPGLLDSNGRIQMVRKDVASLYVGKPPLPGGRALTAFEQQMRAKANAAAGPPTGKLVAGEIVPVANEKATETFIQSMEKIGYRVVRKDDKKTVFRKFASVEPDDDSPSFQSAEYDEGPSFDAAKPRPKRGYQDLTPGEHKRYKVYEEDGTLIHETTDYDEAHDMADVENGYVNDIGEKPPSSRARGVDELIALRENAARNGDQRQVIQLDEEIRNLTEPSLARATAGKGLVASVDIRRTVQNITKDYTSPLSGIMAREGLQNALDAADQLGPNGVVKIRVGDKTIEVFDNGKGMDEDTLSEKLVTMFATGKENEAGATGGKGIGSASYIFGGKYFTIETVAVDAKDGRKYQITASGTPDQFLDPVHGSDWDRVRVSDSTPTGTTIEVQLKDEQNTRNTREMVKNILDHTRDRPSKIMYDEYGLTSDTPLRDVIPDQYNSVKDINFTNSDTDKLVGDFVTHDSRVKVQVPASDLSVERSSIQIHYLNNGMYQFSEPLYATKKITGLPEHAVVNIEPQVDEMHDNYPFINTREDVKKDIREIIGTFLRKNVTGPAVDKSKNRTQELYDSMGQMTVPGLKRKPLLLDPGNRLTPQEVERLNKNPLVVNILKFYDSLVDNIILHANKPEWADRLEGVGLSFDPGSHGLHIPNPTTGKSSIAFNPFLRIEQGLTPRDAAYKAVGTGQHEVAHIGNEAGAPIQFNPSDVDDPRVGAEYFQAYINELINHGDVGLRNTGHGMGFAHRLGEVYATFGAKRRINATEVLTNLYTGGNKSGGYSPEVQELLHLYSQSRGRAEVTEDLLTRTGVKQANTGPTGEGNIPGTGSTDGDGTSAVDIMSEFKGRPWARIKSATGWGQGQSGKEPGKAKEVNYIKEALSVPTNATTMLDASAPGRQGLPLILTPEFWKAGYAMFKGISYEGFKQIDADLRSKDIMVRHINEDTGKLEKSFGDLIGTKMFSPASEPGPRAESTASRWLEMGIGRRVADQETGRKVWEPTRGSKLWQHTIGYPIRATNRMYITFLNHLNVNRTEKLLNLARDMAMEGVEKGKVRQGIMPWKTKISPEDAQNLNPYHNLVRGKEIADFVNTATGHGPLKTHLLPYKKAEVSLESATDKLSYVLFSPGLLARNVRMMNPNTYIMASPFVRKQYLKAAVSTAAAWWISAELIKKAAGDEATVGMDPTSADFGKVRLGDARMDLSGGFGPFAVAYARAYMGGATSSASGEFHRFGSGYQAQTQEDMMQRFFVNKLNPVTKFAYDIASASEYNPFHVGDRSVQLFVPLIVQDLMELYEEDPSLVPWMGTAAAFGGGTQVYSKGESVSKFLQPDNDWLVTGGGMKDLMPWNLGTDEEPRAFPWSER